MSPADRARAAHQAAEDATHPADRAAFKASAAAWEALCRPGRPWSYEPLTRDVAALRRELALASGPFQPPPPAPEPPKGPKPASAPLVQELRRNGGPAARELADRLSRQPATIEF